MQVLNDIRDWSIYKIVNPTDRVYIGISTDVVKRKKRYHSADCKNQTALYKSIIKYGFDSHSFELIDSFTSGQEYAFGKEMFWIRSFMSNSDKFPECRGLNMTGGGRGSIGKKMSEETKAKLRNANLGKKYSDETKKKLSLLRKGKKINVTWSEERRREQSSRLAGFRHSDEAKIKISLASKGNKHCLGKKQTADRVAHRVKFIIANKFALGRVQSAEEKEKRRESLTGLRRTEEQKLAQKERLSNVVGKMVIQYSLDGVYLNEFISLRKAALETKMSRSSIKKIISGETLQPKSFIFKHK